MAWDDKCLPGDMSFDYMFGGNQSGFYPNISGWILSDKKLFQVTYVHGKGRDYDIYIENEWKVKSRKGGIIKVIDNSDGTIETFRVFHDKKWKGNNELGEPVVLENV